MSKNTATNVDFERSVALLVWAELDHVRSQCVALAQSLQQMVDWYGKRGGDADEILPAEQQEPQVARAMHTLVATNGGKG